MWYKKCAYAAPGIDYVKQCFAQVLVLDRSSRQRMYLEVQTYFGVEGEARKDLLPSIGSLRET